MSLHRRRIGITNIAWKVVWPSATVQVLRGAWCLLVFWAERGVFYSAASMCDTPKASTSFRVLILSDPQIIGTHTYASYSPGMTALVSALSDQYIRKAWLAITRQGLGASWWRGRRADLVVFLGDMTDRGRWFDSYPAWSKLQSRWISLFEGVHIVQHTPHTPLTPRAYDAWPAIVVPGNHDIGLPSSETGQFTTANAKAAAWFEREFSPIVNDKYELCEHGMASWNARIPIAVSGRAATHELVLLNAMDLVSMQPIFGNTNRDWDVIKQHAERTTGLIDMLAAQNSTNHSMFLVLFCFFLLTPAIPRVLFTHVPLARDVDRHSCEIPWRSAHHGVYRESHRAGVPGGDILQGGDAQRTYQNLVRSNVSRYVLESIRPAVVFSGDDHDHCEAIHAQQHVGHVTGFNTSLTPELTVKSMSMVEGVKRPGYAWLELYDDATMNYTPCLLPDQVNLWLMVYLPCFLLTLVFLSIWATMRKAKAALLPMAHARASPRANFSVRSLCRDVGHTAIFPLIVWLSFQR